MVMDFLGGNLEELLRESGGKFTIATTVMIADQVIRRLEYMHTHNYLHRDIKPENFTIGFQKSKWSQIFLIDFGLSKTYREPKTGMHIPQSTKLSLTGTARYASINAHLGFL
jgi:casein kinase I family protein HRR25